MEGEKKFLIKLWSILEAPYEMLGLMNSPVGRFGFTSFASFLALSYFKPESFYFGDQARPFSLLSDDPKSTPFPPMIFSLLMGLFSVILI
jgi:hypothetical protein